MLELGLHVLRAVGVDRHVRVEVARQGRRLHFLRYVDDFLEARHAKRYLNKHREMVSDQKQYIEKYEILTTLNLKKYLKHTCIHW